MKAYSLDGQYKSYRNGVNYTYAGSWMLDGGLLSWTAEITHNGEYRGTATGELLVKPGPSEERYVRRAIEEAIDHSPSVS